MVLLLSVGSAAAAEWRVDTTDRGEAIAWVDAAEPANEIHARLQVECDRVARRPIVSMLLSEPTTTDRVGFSFRLDQGPIEHRIVPVGTNLQSVSLNINYIRLARGKPNSIAVKREAEEDWSA